MMVVETLPADWIRVAADGEGLTRRHEGAKEAGTKEGRRRLIDFFDLSSDGDFF